MDTRKPKHEQESFSQPAGHKDAGIDCKERPNLALLPLGRVLKRKEGKSTIQKESLS
jgi:hypothetical protein